MRAWNQHAASNVLTESLWLIDESAEKSAPKTILSFRFNDSYIEIWLFLTNLSETSKGKRYVSLFRMWNELNFCTWGRNDCRWHAESKSHHKYLKSKSANRTLQSLILYKLLRLTVWRQWQKVKLCNVSWLRTWICPWPEQSLNIWCPDQSH